VSKRQSGRPLSSSRRDGGWSDRRIRWNFRGPARIKGMASRAHPFADVRHSGLPLVRVRGGVLRLVRAPGRRGAWSPEEVAHVLNGRRAELLGVLGRRRDGAGVPAGVRQEIVDEAISLVVMSRDPIRNEQHLEGSFWATVRLLLVEHRSGRHSVRVGSRRRVDFELAAVLPDGSEPSEMVEARERIARAADYMAQLDAFEQQVVTLMATRGIGVKLAARSLGVPTKTVVAAARSADQKLDQIAVIAAAGRMCEYRHPAIAAYAQGTARAQEERAAKAHLAACARCQGAYVLTVREMRGRDFQRRASAVFVPLPVLAAGAHGSLLDRLTAFASNYRLPSSGGSGERTVGLLGGGGFAAKVAVAGTAVVVAGAGVVGITSSVRNIGSHHPHHAHVLRSRVAHHQPSNAAEPGLRAAAVSAREVSPSKRPVRFAQVRLGSGGFSYLGGAASGGPHRHSASAPTSSSRTAEAASLRYLGGNSSSPPTSTTSSPTATAQRNETSAGGGQFSP
jgi:DNA-directed RNA polymerase specialized sigma24 family protein